MEFSEKGTMDPMNGYFSPINGLESVNGIQFSLCWTPTNLIFAHRVISSIPYTIPVLPSSAHCTMRIVLHVSYKACSKITCIELLRELCATYREKIVHHWKACPFPR